MKKLLSIAVGALMVPVVVFSTVSAIGMGQFPQGNFYYSPQNGVAVDPASLTCGNTLTLKIRAHNAGPGVVENTTVHASLPSTVATNHVSTATISSPFAEPNSTSDTMTVNLDKAGRLTYVAGSTELLDSAGNKLSNLPDTLTTTGVNIGTVNVSVQEIRSVQFKVKAECPTTPPPVTPPAPTKPVTPAAPQVLAATGPAETFAQIVGVSALAGAISYYIRSRRANILG